MQTCMQADTFIRAQDFVSIGNFVAGVTGLDSAMPCRPHGPRLKRFIDHSQIHTLAQWYELQLVRGHAPTSMDRCPLFAALTWGWKCGWHNMPWVSITSKESDYFSIFFFGLQKTRDLHPSTWHAQLPRFHFCPAAFCLPIAAGW